jgi:hypothetical protein
MNKNHIHLIVILLHFVPVMEGAKQVQPDQGNSGNYEYYRLFSDRSVYITGETLRFGVINLSSDSVRESDLSTVYYTELISPSGRAYSAAKVSMDSLIGEGQLNIPSSIATGTYYLRGYSGYMRNAGPEYFSYLEIQVINPGSSKTLPVGKTGKRAIVLDSTDAYKNRSFIAVQTDKKVYKNRSRVHATIINNRNDEQLLLSISVCRKGTLGIQHFAASQTPVNYSDSMEYLPEIRGISLGGKVISSTDREPVPYALVYLSSLDAEREFYCNYTDEKGDFLFSFENQSGEKQLFLSARKAGTPGNEILVKKDFSQAFIPLPSRPLTPPDSMIETYIDLSLNAQINRQYSNRNIEQETHRKKSNIFFYGNPDYIVRFEDYINLPNLEEYFRELVPQASIRERNGHKYFRMHGSHPDLNIFDPLVMIDGIAMFSAEKLLAVSPRYIDRIEIVDAPFIRGEVTFGGIINIVSKNDDLGYVDLPSSGLLINYQMFSESTAMDTVPPSSLPNIPDLRNTLYWKCCIIAEASATFSFYTNDVPGIYEITIQGFTRKGEYFRTSRDFTVSDQD